jgi:hypothetical protein
VEEFLATSGAHRENSLFAYFAAKGGAVSLRFRLAGGGKGIRTLSTASDILISALVSTTYRDLTV